MTCDPEDDEEFVIARPRLIVEVLSPSTALTDRREKLLAYQKAESLVEYVLVEQDAMQATRHLRDAQGRWLKEELAAADTLTLDSIGLSFPLAQLSEDVQVRRLIS